MGWNIFIYGTLKKGEPNHWLIKKLRNHARFLSQAQTKEKLPLGIGSDVSWCHLAIKRTPAGFFKKIYQNFLSRKSAKTV